MKKLIFVALASTILFAQDYSSMSLEELQALKGSVPTQDRSTYREALREKKQALTPRQRRALKNQNRQRGYQNNREKRQMRGMY